MTQLSIYDLLTDENTYTPFNCKFEQKVVSIGGGKSLCAEMGLWTNCREVGYCTSDHRKHRIELEDLD